MKLSDLLGKRIETKEGKLLGHVMTVYAKRQENGSFVITDLVYGKSSLLTRLGFNKFHGKRVDWKEVKKVGRTKIITIL